MSATALLWCLWIVSHLVIACLIAEDAYIAMTIVGGKAPFSIMRKDLESSSRRDHHVNGFNFLGCI